MIHRAAAPASFPNTFKPAGPAIFPVGFGPPTAH
jgi:hypothetical protein